MTEAPEPSEDRVIKGFKAWFWRPPRRHGEVLEDRTVTFLELFYDLVYVVVIAQAAHHLAAHVSLQGFLEFAVIFGLIWIAWLNGSLYHEVHGQRDGRTRVFVFIQMAILALLAIFTADAAGETGTAFALIYTAYLLVLSWLWYSVRRRDEQQYMRVTAMYLTQMGITSAAMVVSAFVSDELRLAIWAGIVILWAGSFLLMGTIPSVAETWTTGLRVTESMAERFGLFTIIVLGEVVVGVIDGMAEAGHEIGHDFVTYATGLLALIVGFGLWWMYFDLIGRRLPREQGSAGPRWILAHGFIGLGIAAAGAAMVGLILHAHDGVTPAESAWLLAVSVAIVLVAIAAALQTLEHWEAWADVYRPTAVALLLGAAGALALGWLQPAPWLLTLLTGVILSLIWGVAMALSWRDGQAPSADLPN